MTDKERLSAAIDEAAELMGKALVILEEAMPWLRGKDTAEIFREIADARLNATRGQI